MKKKKISLVLSSIFVFSLFSCGQKPSETYFKITWKNYDGSTLKVDEKVLKGTTPSYQGEIPTREKDEEYTYTFSSWDKEIVPANKDETYTAIYTSEVNKYVITFINDDNTILQQETLSYGTIPTFKGESPTKNKDAEFTYTFLSWSPEIKEVNGDITYKATYSKVTNKYQVTWVNYDDTILKIDNVELSSITGLSTSLINALRNRRRDIKKVEFESAIKLAESLKISAHTLLNN